ncbi:MAG: hypothetical protein F6K22_13715 [Okeania sp. SIO2F4]|nr:hypothetical protein [Okeania sp. SIO2F4]NES03802.1 hypothetical protein [Okeania sp. SIO2F4]
MANSTANTNYHAFLLHILVRGRWGDHEDRLMGKWQANTPLILRNIAKK